MGFSGNNIIKTNSFYKGEDIMRNEKLNNNKFKELKKEQLYNISGGEEKRRVGGVVCSVVYAVYNLVTGSNA